MNVSRLGPSAILVAVTSTACSTPVRTVPPPTAPHFAAARETVNEDLAGRRWTMVIAPSCQTIAAENPRILGDSVYYTDVFDRARRVVSATDVAWISGRSTKAGAKQGAKVGAAVWGAGSALLLMVGLSAGTPRDGPPASLAAVIIAAGTAIPVVGIATLLGAADGAVRYFVFEPTRDACPPPAEARTSTGAGKGSPSG